MDTTDHGRHLGRPGEPESYARGAARFAARFSQPFSTVTRASSLYRGSGPLAGSPEELPADDGSEYTGPTTITYEFLELPDHGFCIVLHISFDPLGGRPAIFQWVILPYLGEGQQQQYKYGPGHASIKIGI